MEEPPANTLPDNRYISILLIVGLAVCVVFLFLFLTNLSPTPPEVARETSWILESYADSTGILIPVIGGSDITTRFSTNGTLSGTSGCNAYTAAYLVSGKKIAITPAVRTRLTCAEPGIMPQESAFLTDLPRAAFIQTGGEGMKLLDNESRVILAYRLA